MPTLRQQFQELSNEDKLRFFKMTEQLLLGLQEKSERGLETLGRTQRVMQITELLGLKKLLSSIQRSRNKLEKDANADVSKVWDRVQKHLASDGGK